MRLYKTNLKSDPGQEIDPSDIAKAFWSSDEAETWRGHTGPLERAAMGYVTEEFGSWSTPEDWDAIFDVIYATMPRS